MVDVTSKWDALNAISGDEMHHEPTDGRHLLHHSLPLQVSRDPNKPRVAIIRTSDRISFKRCRRLWGWTSHLRHNLEPVSAVTPLWFGSGFHFALEDFHGWNRFGHPKKAFLAYVAARQKYDPKKVPDEIDQLIELGSGMLDYYILWLQQRKNSIWKTFWYNGEPQVEVNFRIQIPWEKGKFGWDEVYYSGTIDRICIDEYDLLWPCDYKTAAQMATLHYLTDPQINAYMWGAPFIYPEHKIGGFLYQQHKKKVPHGGQRLLNGGLSTAKNQETSSIMYRLGMIEIFGSVEAAPQANQNYLTQLKLEEDILYDKYVRIDKVGRNERNAQSEGVKVLMEIEDMLNPDLPLYPNPTRDCSGNYTCSFLSPCVSMDDGSDWLTDLEQTTQKRAPSYDSWREKIIWPGDPLHEDSKPPEDDRSWLD